MDVGEAGQQRSSASKPPKFDVYQNPVLSAALTSSSLRPSVYTFLFIIFLFCASAFAIFFSVARENSFVITSGLGLQYAALSGVSSKMILISASFFLCGTSLALLKAISQWRPRNAIDVMVLSPSEGTKELTRLTDRQLGFLGLRPKAESIPKEFSNKHPKSATSPSSPENVLVPLHQPFIDSNHSTRTSSGKSSTCGGSTMHSLTTTGKSPASPSMYLVRTIASPSAASLLSSSLKTSPSADQFSASPWSSKRPRFRKEITTEEEFENFLADVDEKISETASKFATPPPNINGFGVASPNTIASTVNTSGTTRSTPLRPVRMSPGSKKFTTPPKKGEGDLPPPMSMEESIKSFEHLGIFPQIEQWRDRLRQWFSAILLRPLLCKIETSHLKVMDAAAKLGISLTISQIGSNAPSASTSILSPIERTGEWKASYAADEEGILHQLRATLAQALDASMQKSSLTNFQQLSQHITSATVLQELIDAIAEHQRLHALMKGEWGKGLLPQSNIRAHYTVQRIRELAEGTCLKNYEYLGSGEVYDKVPSDSHLLLYLFCSFLEYPNWMLHIDPTAFAGMQSSKNPLFLGVLPPKERFPEKYIAVLSGAPSVLHPGACILAVGKQSSPTFVLYWNKKPQFSLQGRTALWDSILLLCHEISVNYDGVVRGMHLGSSAMGILPVIGQETENQ